VVGDSRVVHKLIDNYVFVRRDHPDPYYYRTEGTKYISAVLTAVNGRVRQLSTVRDADITKMRKQIQVETDQGIEVGDEVEVMSGAYKGIRGRVIEEIPEKDSVQVYISLRSKQAIVTLPRSFLRFVTHEEAGDTPAFSPFRTKYLRITEWFRRASVPLSAQLASFEVLDKQYTNVAKLHPLADGVSTLVPDIISRKRVEEVAFQDFDELQKRSGTVLVLHRAHRLQREIELAPLLVVPPSIDPLEGLVGQVGVLAWLTLPFASLDRQVGAGEVLQALPELSSTDAMEALCRQLEVYDSTAEAIKRLRYQVGQVESKLKKAEQEDARERKRRAAKRRR